MLIAPYKEAKTAFDKVIRRLAGKLLYNTSIKPKTKTQKIKRDVLWHTYHYGKPYLLFTIIDRLTRKLGNRKDSLLTKLPNFLIPNSYRPGITVKEDNPVRVRLIIKLTPYPKLKWLRNFIFDMWHYRTLDFKLFKVKYGKARALDKKDN